MDDSKSFLCKHNIGLSIKLKNYKVHHIVISVPLDERQKRGRRVKNKGWWWKEKFVGKIVMVNLHPNIP